MNTKIWTTRLLILTIAVTLCGLPEMLQAQAGQVGQPAEPSAMQTAPQTAPPAPSQPATAQSPEETPAQSPGMVDPSKGPLTPVPSSTEELPNAPSAANPPATPAQPAQAGQQQNAQQPVGAATAQTGPTAGGVASKPAGNAIAPAKQRQVRSLLIKLGAIAAAGVAIGTVAALSRGSSSKPPGAK